MIIKWIVCKVPPSSKEAFSSAQQQWKALAGVKGFYGQFGGWNRKDPREACIVSLWENRESYERFMKREHDRIFYGSGQKNTYESIQVHLYRNKMELKASQGAMIGEGALLRIADWVIKAEKNNHFIKMQEKVWTPGMASAPGMIGGWFAESIQAPYRYLVLSLWETEQHHDAYARECLSDLLRAAQTEKDIQAMDGKVIRLENSWSVGS